MKVDVVITRDGKISVFTREGSFNEGLEKILELLNLLRAEGIAIEIEGDIEQHRHSESKVHSEVKHHVSNP